MTRLLELIVPARIGRPFRWFLSSFWLANLGDGLLLAAGPLLVASQTRNPALVALATVLQRLPWMIFGLAAGVVADRFDRRRVALLTDGARIVVLAFLGTLVAIDQVNIAIVLVVLFLMGVAEAFSDTAIDAMMPSLVADEDLGIANARVMFGYMGMNNLAGPPIGAMLFGMGMAVPFLAQVVLLAAALVCVTQLRLPHVERSSATTTNAWIEIREGLVWLWRNPPVRTLSLALTTLNITFGAAMAVMVLYAIEHLDMGEAGFGLLLGASAVGGLIGSASYGFLEARYKLSTILRVVLITETLTHLGLALATTGWMAMGVSVVFGAEASVWGTASRLLRQRAVPEELQGRIGAAYRMLGQTGMIVGGVIAGVLAGAFGVIAPYWFAFFGSVVIVALIWSQIDDVANVESTT